MSFSSLALSGRTPVRSQLRRAAKTNVFVYVDWLTSQLIYIHIHTDTVTADEKERPRGCQPQTAALTDN